jgi:hypothetical protein
MGGGTIGRVVTGVVTGGLSEVAKAGVKAITPKVPQVAGIPNRADKKVRDAGDEQRRNDRKRRGRASTILTGRTKNPLGGNSNGGGLG